MSADVLLEICVDSLASVYAAEAGGADRLELCAGLSEGGTTPTLGFLESARAATDLPIFVLLRPRAGDFIYTDEEVKCIFRDLEVAREHGADGFVAGALLPGGALDEPFLERLLEACGELPLTFHRAFDVCTNPLGTLDRLIQLGVPRLLTSGQADRAEDGIELLAEMFERAGERLVVMPGGGLREETAELLAAETGAREFHGSASLPVLGCDKFPARVTDQARVARLRQFLIEGREFQAGASTP